jgi:DNA primase
VASFTDAVEEIRRRIDIVDLISQDVALRKGGRNLKGLCPFHNERTPSFHVSPEKQIWKCFGCGAGGDIFSYIQKRDNLSFPEAVEWLARRAGVTIEYGGRGGEQVRSEKEQILRVNEVACAFFQKMLRESAKARDYLAKRGLSESAVEKYKLGYAPDSWDTLVRHLAREGVPASYALKAGLIIARDGSGGYYDRFRDRLIFPIFDAFDRIVGFGGRALGDDPAKYINSPESVVFAKNRILYGLNFARRAIVEQDMVIVVEGYMDAITTQEAGFENTVATMGTALTEEHVNVLGRFTKKAVLAFDADSAGMAAALRSSLFFERSGFDVRILNMPKGEDPDSLLRAGDRSRFAILVKEALPILDYRVKLALAKHDLSTDEGKAAALKSAIRVLAETESIVERERLIKQLAKYHPNFSTGTARAEDHIRAEVEAARRRLTRGAQEQTESKVSAQEGFRRQNFLDKLERIVLGMIIAEKVEPDKVFDALPSNKFSGESTRQLAEALHSQYLELGKIHVETLVTKLEGKPAGDLLVDLTVGYDPSELNYSLEEVVRTIELEKKRMRHARMRELARKFQEGVIKRGDEEFEEYWQLVRELKGANADRVIKASESDS